MYGGFWLITSGAFVGQELAAEFGQMPPSFLPVGTRRLFEYQLEQIGRERPVFLTLPEGYDIPIDDLRRLEICGATVLLVPEGLSLGESVLFALNLIGGGDQPLWLLHGDTLIDGLPPKEVDRIGIAVGSDGYSWAEVELEDNRVVTVETVPAGVPVDRGKPIACGYFAFEHATELVRSITRKRGRFIDGILDYATTHPLQAVQIDRWYDFGHTQTYFRSRRMVTTARHFNSLTINGRTARKTSNDADKMHAEAGWLRSVPPALQIYTARLIDAGEEPDGRAFYETEYGYVPTLSELFVFGTVNPANWANVLQSCQLFLSACVEEKGDEPADPLLRELTVTKTLERLNRFAGESGFDIDRPLRYDDRPLPSLIKIAEEVANVIEFNSGRRSNVMHGDFCFSNILYDSRVQRVRVIDPRGYVFAGRPSIHGDVRYDVAKLAHSIVGRYDQIIAGRYRLATPFDGNFLIEFEQSPHHLWLEGALEDFSVDGLLGGAPEVQALTIGLFLSMLPLHSDRSDRQTAFIANALRLFRKLETKVT